MRAFLRDTGNITKRYAQDPYLVANRLGFKWLQHNTQQALQNTVMLSLVGSGKPQFVQSYQDIQNILNYKPVQKAKTGDLSIQDIKANAEQLYQMVIGATAKTQQQSTQT